MSNPNKPNRNVIPDLSNTVEAKALSAKITDKGGLSVYWPDGMSRFPTTLYREQWELLAANMPKILAFIEANKAKLPTKAAKAQEDGRTAL